MISPRSRANNFSARTCAINFGIFAFLIEQLKIVYDHHRASGALRWEVEIQTDALPADCVS